MTTDEFAATAMEWLATARHPTTGRPFTEMVYQPMLEVLDYLRANGFTTYIASAGGIEFMRPWAEDVYGIPPERVIGSSIKTAYEKYPQLKKVVPALGYYGDQLAELKATIDAADCDSVVIGTPIDLRRVVEIDKPATRVRYDLKAHDNDRLVKAIEAGIRS